MSSDSKEMSNDQSATPNSPEANTNGAGTAKSNKPKARAVFNASSLFTSENFPTLTSQNQEMEFGRFSAGRILESRGRMDGQTGAAAREFTMSSEDFPALPATQRTEGASSCDVAPLFKNLSLSSPSTNLDSSLASGATGGEQSQVKKGIQTSPDGKVTNIPASMLKDQFGIAGLLTMIRAAKTDPNLVSLVLGEDLTSLGLDLNSPEYLYPTFAGPWAETPIQPQNIDFDVPPEYRFSQNVRDKLPPVKLGECNEDLLFYMFYSNPGDMAQMAAAVELYDHDWRYHIVQKIWIKQIAVIEKTSTYEHGIYCYFDVKSWRKGLKEIRLELKDLEGRPQIPSMPNQSQQ